MMMMIMHCICMAILLLLAVPPMPVIAQFDPQPEDFLQWVDRINNGTAPLPSCAEVGISEALGCNALCQAIDGGNVDVSNTRNTGDNFVCSCEKRVACNDEPTCAQLNILPGRVLDGCNSICGDLFVAVEDKIEYAGDITAANKDLTHFVVECRCDGEVRCTDYILFSDLAQPLTCTGLSIDSMTTCDDYCESTGGGLFDLGGNYTIDDETNDGTCDCLGTSVNALKDVDIAQACTDIPVAQGPQACTLQDPCPPTAAPGVDSTADSGTFCLRCWVGIIPTFAAVAMTGLLVGFF